MLKGLTFALAGAAALAFSQVASAADVTKLFAKYQPGSTATVDHSAWDSLLQAYVKTDPQGLNRVDYKTFKAKDHGSLKAYVKQLENVDVGALDKSEQFAFWANLYNAKTVEVILDHYPVTSIRKITINQSLIGFIKKSVGAGGPWKAKITQVGGQPLSLDDIEHAILRPIFKDPRVHYAVNCASIGCPNLRRNAFTGESLEAELNAGAKDYINSTRGFDARGGNVTASSIYNWFQVDFGGSKQGVLEHALKYANPELKAKLTAAKNITGYAYDWNLNDIQN